MWCLLDWRNKAGKKNKLKENIKYLEEFSEQIDKNLKEIKKIAQDINAIKEDLKTKISKTFTKIRNKTNEREEEILSELDKLMDAEFIKEDIIKQNEMLRPQLKTYLEKYKIVDRE